MLFELLTVRATLYLRATVWAVLVMMLTLQNGCAYRAGFSERRIPGGYELVAVPVFKNKTVEAGAEVYFTNAMVQEVERAKLAKVVSKSEAQVTLLGTIVKIDYIASGPTVYNYGDLTNFVPQGTVLNVGYRALVTVQVELHRNSDDRVLWSGTLSGERSYATPRIGVTSLNSANALYNHSAHYQALQAMALDLMSEAHDRLTENF